MRILVFAHRLEIGGTQVNAIELAAHLRDRYGHDVSIVATPGPMLALVEDHGLRFHPAPDAHRHPSLERARAVARAIRTERPDVLHVWDVPQYLDSFGVACGMARIPTLVTSMSMTVERLLPMHLPVTLGTPDLAAQSLAGGRARTRLLLPPVDVVRNAPDAVSSRVFRERHGFAPDDILVVTISRLVSWMKAESIRDTISAVATLSEKLPIRFAIVGDGSSRGEIETLVDATNKALGRRSIVLTGPAVDPREAYAAADVVVGMGGSGLRALSFGKPLVVAGERGFSMPFTPETSAFFLQRGIYGLGDGSDGAERMAANLRHLIIDYDRDELATFGRRFIMQHFSLEAVGQHLETLLRETRGRPLGTRDFTREASRLVGLMAARNVVPKAIRSRLRRPR